MTTVNVLDTTCLPPGTRVGPWCLLARRGRGTYGTVYRALRVGHEADGPVALKLALYASDPRFAREVELLSRVRHPAVPRLHDSGQWQHPSGACYPYVVMEWVEGTALYEWAEQHAVSSRTVLRLLARLARALEATHSAGGVHRDVKGANVMVRHEDGLAFLTDFGSGHYQGAAPLTWQVFPPGMASYRSPEAARFPLTAPPMTHYSPGPADDVFALGVTAYRLVTRDYPPCTDIRDAESSAWHQSGVGAEAPRALNPRCCTELNTLVHRMLSLRPEARGSARELAEALEDCARRAGPEADAPLWAQTTPRPAEPLAAPEPVPPQVASRPQRSWRVTTAVTLAVLLGCGAWLSGEAGRWLRVLAPLSATEGGTVAALEAALRSLLGFVPPYPSSVEPAAREVPSKPFSGQLRPNAKGRCSRSAEVVINGGCWLRIHVDDPEQCKDSGYLYQGGCYLPVAEPTKAPVASSVNDSAQR